MSTSCSGNCETCPSREKEDPSCKVALALKGVKHKVVVMSGKGGVGKSTVAVNLAQALAADGLKVGVLDVDVHGPSVPAMLGLEHASLLKDEDGKILPVEANGLKVVSVGFLLATDDTPVVWRGPLKIGVIQQFLGDVQWGELDALVVDCPPGTGDEPLTVCQLLAGTADGAILVTTPQQVASLDVSKSICFCHQLDFPILGLIENMAGFVCPHCGKVSEIFSAGAGAALADHYGVPLLGRIPLDPLVCAQGDAGEPFVRKGGDSPTNRAFREILGRLNFSSVGN